MNNDSLLVSRDEQFEEIHLRDYVAVIWRKKYLIFLISFLTLLGVWTWTGLQHPVFKAEASLEIQSDDSGSLSLEDMFDFGGMGGRTDEMLSTESAILKSLPVLTRVVELSNLQLVIDRGQAIGHGYWNKISGLIQKVINSNSSGVRVGKQECNALLRQETVPLRIISSRVAPLKMSLQLSLMVTPQGLFELKDKNGQSLAQGRVGKETRSELFDFVIKGDLPEVVTEYRVLAMQLDAAVRYVEANLDVSPARNSRLLSIVFETALPDEAEPILKNVIQAYQEQKIRQKSQTASKALIFLNDQLDTLDSQMGQATGRLKDFKEDHPLVSLPASAQNTVEQLAQAEQTRYQLARQEKQAGFLLESLQQRKAVNREDLYALGNALDNRVVLGLGSSLNKLEIERAAALNQYTSKHPRIKTLVRQIAQIKIKINSELRSIIKALGSEQQTLNTEIKRLEKELGTLPKAEQELVELRRQAKVFEDSYAFLLAKKSELQITKASQSGNMWVVNPAHTLPGYVKPNVRLNILLALIIGLTLGMGLSFFLEYMDDTVKTPKDLEAFTNKPVLGNIGHFEPKASKRQSGLQLLDEPTSQVSEGLRTLRSNLFFTGVDTPVRSFLVTSALPGAGKSTICANLAVSIAQTGKKILIVDTDLRKPTVHRNFRVRRSPGLVNALLEDDSLASVLEFVQPYKHQENLSILSCGDIPPNPSELLSSEKMRKLASQLYDEFDYVLFDTPPIMATSDALILGQFVDRTIFVVRSGQTRKAALQESLKNMRAMAGKVSGLVLNDVDFHKERYYYYYYSYYAKSYSSYGAENQEEAIKRKKKRKA